MNCIARSPALLRYNRRMILAMAFYLTILIAAKLTLRHYPSHALAIALAFVTSLAMVAVIAIVGLYLKEEADEFQRELLVQNLLWATAGTLSITSTWGLIELFSAAVPRFPVFYVFVLFWILFGLASVPLRLRYRSSPND